MRKEIPQILIGSSNPKEAYAQAVTEGMIDPSLGVRPFNRRAKHYERPDKPAKFTDYFDFDHNPLKPNEQVALLFGRPLERAIVVERYLGDVELPLIPMTFQEQWALAPKTYEERDRVANQLEMDILESMARENIPILHSSSRAKTEASIAQKRSLKTPEKRDLPLIDLYGVRIVTDYDGPIQVKNAVYSVGYVPYEYPWGVKGYEYYQFTDPDDESRVLYQARHFRIMFGGRGMQQIAEVQIMTLKEYEIAEASRREYEMENGKFSSQ